MVAKTRKKRITKLPLSNSWQTTLSKKYYNSVINHTQSEVDESIFKVGECYTFNLSRIKKYYDLFYLEIFEPAVHTATIYKITKSAPTVKLLLFYSSYAKPTNEDESTKPVLLCLGSYLGRSGDIELMEGGNTKSVNRMWYTKFLYNNQVLVYQWHENPKILKAYYNHYTKKRLRPYSTNRFFGLLRTTTLSNFMDFRNLKRL